MSVPLKLPQELWDEITSYLPSLSACNAASAFNFQSHAYDRVWSMVFKTEAWHESTAGQDSNIVLIGTDLDILSSTQGTSVRPRLVLAVSDHAGDLQYNDDLLCSSLCATYQGPGEYELEQLAITVGRFDVPEILGKDFGYLFAKNEKNNLETKYCYWRDPKKKFRTTQRQDIRGIGGTITEAEDLEPIFLLNLRPPARSYPENLMPRPCRAGNVPEQFIFRNFGGPSFWTSYQPLVDVIVGHQSETGEYAFDEFIFTNDKYEGYRRQHVDWNKVAEANSGYNCRNFVRSNCLE
jgi:hypothetical protein